jgi:hypothetical protein
VVLAEVIMPQWARDEVWFGKGSGDSGSYIKTLIEVYRYCEKARRYDGRNFRLVSRR